VAERTILFTDLALIGPLDYRRWFNREPTGDTFIETFVANTLRMRTTR
jgi:hypothetical protein